MQRAVLFGAITTIALLSSETATSQEWRLEPAFGSTSLTSGFLPDPTEMPVVVGDGAGLIDVSTLGLVDRRSGMACGPGLIARAPDFRFNLTAGAPFDFLRFYVHTHNNTDATLLINQPDDTWRCNDDSHETSMPAIDFRAAQVGQHDIWVGTHSQTSGTPATLYITELESNHPGTQVAAAADRATPGSTPGNFASMTVAPGFMPDPLTVTGTSGGNVSASGMVSLNGGHCGGHVSANPDHLLTLNEQFSYLRIDAVSPDGGETTMIVQDGTGNIWCSREDEGEDPNPRIEGPMNAGTYRVWVGSDAAGMYHPYNLSVTEVRAP